MSNSDRRYKNSIYEQLTRISKALASPRRLELIDLLCQGERTVETLAREAGLTVANTSQHLQVLRGAHLVEAEKVGLFVTYRLADEEIGEFFLALRKLAEARLADLEQITRLFFEGREGLDGVDRHRLLELVREGAVTVLDVRPAEEYKAGHIVGAVSIPLKELEARLGELPRDQEIVAYCRGPYCVLAIHAVELLRARGFRASRLKDGVLEWRAMGLPVADEGEAN